MRWLFFVIFFIASPAFACGFLDKSEPSVGAELSASPAQLKLWMTQDIDVTRSSVKLFDARGHTIQLNHPESDISDATAMVVKVPVSLAAGNYKVRWHVVAKGCDHITEGSYGFKIIH